MKIKQYVYMKPADDEGGSGGGGDRGDNFTPTTSETAAATASENVEAAAAAAAAAAAPAAEGTQNAEGEAAGEEKKAGEGEEAGRDEKGRFTGKGVIPIGDHKRVLEKEREAREVAERKLVELQAQLKQVDKGADLEKLEEEIKGLEKQHAKAVLDGDVEKAAELAGTIRLKERTIQLNSSENLSAQARLQAAEEVRVEMAIKSLEDTYPVLKEGSEVYDPDIVEIVLAKQRNLIDNERMTPSQALVKAAEKIMAKIMPASRQDDPPKGGLAAAKGASERKEETVARNVDTAKRQPASTKDTGMDSTAAGIKDNIDVSKLTTAEFDALPESVRSRLRGDML